MGNTQDIFFYNSLPKIMIHDDFRIYDIYCAGRLGTNGVKQIHFLGVWNIWSIQTTNQISLYSPWPRDRHQQWWMDPRWHPSFWAIHLPGSLRFPATTMRLPGSMGNSCHSGVKWLPVALKAMVGPQGKQLLCRQSQSPGPSWNSFSTRRDVMNSWWISIEDERGVAAPSGTVLLRISAKSDWAAEAVRSQSAWTWSCTLGCWT